MKSALFIVNDQERVLYMLLSNSGFQIDETVVGRVRFISSTEVNVYDVTDTCAPSETIFTSCLNKTPSRNVSFHGSVAYLYMMNGSSVQYALNTTMPTNVTKAAPGQIIINLAQASMKPSTGTLTTYTNPGQSPFLGTIADKQQQQQQPKYTFLGNLSQPKFQPQGVPPLGNPGTLPIIPSQVNQVQQSAPFKGTIADNKQSPFKGTVADNQQSPPFKGTVADAQQAPFKGTTATLSADQQNILSIFDTALSIGNMLSATPTEMRSAEMTTPESNNMVVSSAQAAIPSDNYYNILGIRPNSREQEIKQAYRRKSLQYHPDKTMNLPPDQQATAADNFRKVSEAYQVLSDPTLKQQYDRQHQTGGGSMLAFKFEDPLTFFKKIFGETK
jgi:DnaJ domain